MYQEMPREQWLLNTLEFIRHEGSVLCEKYGCSSPATDERSRAVHFVNRSGTTVRVATSGDLVGRLSIDGQEENGTKFHQELPQDPSELTPAFIAQSGLTPEQIENLERMFLGVYKTDCISARQYLSTIRGLPPYEKAVQDLVRTAMGRFGIEGNASRIPGKPGDRVRVEKVLFLRSPDDHNWLQVTNTDVGYGDPNRGLKITWLHEKPAGKLRRVLDEPQFVTLPEFPRNYRIGLLGNEALFEQIAGSIRVGELPILTDILQGARRCEMIDYLRQFWLAKGNSRLSISTTDRIMPSPLAK